MDKVELSDSKRPQVRCRIGIQPRKARMQPLCAKMLERLAGPDIDRLSIVRYNELAVSDTLTQVEFCCANVDQIKTLIERKIGVSFFHDLDKPGLEIIQK